jgi:hypothetical protein
MKVASNQSPSYSMKAAGCVLFPVPILLFCGNILGFLTEIELCTCMVTVPMISPNKRNKMIKRNMFRLVCVKVNEVELRTVHLLQVIK